MQTRSESCNFCCLTSKRQGRWKRRCRWPACKRAPLPVYSWLRAGARSCALTAKADLHICASQLAQAGRRARGRCGAQNIFVDTGSRSTARLQLRCALLARHFTTRGPLDTECGGYLERIAPVVIFEKPKTPPPGIEPGSSA